ncbi:MAG: hypothetical protein Kow00121_61120 [Elainellaceae cyanobacterium]
MKKLPNPFASINLKSFQTSFEKFKKDKAISPFSWQTALSLSALSWVIYLIVRTENAKTFVSLYGWFFLILGTYWFFLDDKDDKKKLKIPGLKLTINYGPWVVGALVCAALLSYQFLIPNFQTALVVWPLVSVAIAAFPRLLARRVITRRDGTTREDVVLAVPEDVGVRQDLIILILLGVLLSCWFQFNFFVQDLVRQYPSLLNDDFRDSSFIVRIDTPNPEASIGADILTIAEAEIRDALSGQPWLDVQRWLRNIETQVPELEEEILNQAFADTPEIRERSLWQFDAEFTDALPDDVLQLQALWTGPSSASDGYWLQKTCLIRPTSLRLNESSATDGIGPSYEMECQPITSSLQPQDQSNDGEE